MPDLTIAWDALNARGDLVFAAPDLVSGADLETAVLVSLFTDRAAQPDDVIPDGTTDPRGWWADSFTAADGAARPIGSRLWLLSREKGSDQLPGRVRGYIVEALQWLLDDKVCAAIDVACAWISASAIGAQITLTRDGQPPVVLAYPNVWQGVS
jgi:phage gp46-like protein